MNQEVMIVVQSASQAILFLGQVSVGLARFLYKLNKHSNTLLKQALNKGEYQSFGEVDLKKLEQLRGKKLAIVPLTETIKKDLEQKAKELNLLYHIQLKPDPELQQAIIAKQNELEFASVMGKDVEQLKEELIELKNKQEYSLYVDAVEIQKLKHFLKGYEIELAETATVEDAVSGLELAHYEALGIEHHEIETLRNTPMTEHQINALEKDYSYVNSQDGTKYYRRQDRPNIYKPQNKLEAIEVIGYLYGRTDVVPMCERKPVLNQQTHVDTPPAFDWKEQLNLLESKTNFASKEALNQHQQLINEVKDALSTNNQEQLNKLKPNVEKITNAIQKIKIKMT